MSIWESSNTGALIQDTRNRFVTTTGEKKTLTTFLIIGFAVLLFATFFDKNVSSTVMDQNSIFGNIFQNYADQGANVVLFAAFEILAWITWFKVQGNVLRYAMTASLLAMALNQMLAVLMDMLSYTFSMIHNIQKGRPMGMANNTAAVANYPEALRWSLAIALTLFISIAFYYWIGRKGASDLNYLLMAALVGIALVLAATTTINEMKVLWGRFRPYEMVNHMSNFTPWYHLNGKTGHNSFPSGHTMSGWLYLWLAFFVPRKNISWQKVMVYFGIGMGVLTGLSRVRIGAHWLSDVTVSSLIVGTMIFFASRLLQAHYIESRHSDAA
ncbi:phosphatase PAP2 family protein [Lactobacillaceae bacterium L1_55_11]|nr:phosphatase PAP2 family protein [Lactobacillaceae bacterium L1_55_11]